MMKKKQIGDILVEAGLITQKQLHEALEYQKNSNKKIGEILIDKGYVNEKQVIEALEFHLSIPHVNLEKYYIDPEVPKLISEKIAKKHLLIPFNKETNRLMVAMADPLNIYAIDDVKIATGLEVFPAIASHKGIKNAIDQYYGQEHAQKAIEDIKEQYDIEDIDALNEEILNEISNAPVVRLVNSIIQQAVVANASDIHIEPFENIVRIRIRIDGELHEIMTPSKSVHSAIATRIKIMGKMNIAEKRIPQDGRVETSVDGHDVDMRISVLPTVYGEKVAIRLLDRNSFLLDKKQLGLLPENEKLFEKILKNPNGIILVTGPTGSGKTTTLYAVLQDYNKESSNIVTVEDPVEYSLSGINQVQVNQKAGLTFANGLRSILRQDPDIIMIGEIRDSETAQIAMRGAITGHLVLSTLHTNDTASTIARLIDMGIDAYLVSSGLVGIVSQRLVRKICESCKEPHTLNSTELEIMDIEKSQIVYKGKGCSQCNHTGYKGRMAVHEILPINMHIRNLIDKNATLDEIRKAASAQGTISLKDNCRRLVLQGETTVEELIRVAYSLD